ncbi:MAG: hypothetical protein GY716_21550 [bacterium]|nr:hypothetical protein [bacterium]
MGSSRRERGRRRDVLYFAAEDELHGSSLWRADGTGGGTRLVVDPDPAYGFELAPYIVAELNGTVFLKSRTSEDVALWASDGTATGTAPLI